MYKLVELGERFNRPVPDATVIRRQAQAVKDAVKVRIQPVADYLYMETDQEKFHAVRDFPDLTPLWPLACYMWAMPRFFRSEGQILPNPPGVERVEHVCLAAAKSYDKPPVKWVYNFLLWAWHPGFPNMIRQIVMVIGLSGEGRVCDLKPGAHAGEFHYASGGTDRWPSEPSHPLSPELAQGHTLLYPVLLATSLCNRQGARIERVPTPPKLLLRQVERNGWAPDCWHNILVNPARSGGGVRDNGGQNG